MQSINLGTTNSQRIDEALKVQSCDVISPKHSLTSLKILAELGCHQDIFGQPAFVYFFGSAKPYSINFDAKVASKELVILVGTRKT